jgi:ribonuclease HI
VQGLVGQGGLIFLPTFFYDGFLLMWCNFKFEGVLFRIDSRHNDRVDSLLEYATKQAVMTGLNGIETKLLEASGYWQKKKLRMDSWMHLIGDPTDTTAVAFTDGSCQDNPVPCGSGAMLFPGDNEEISLKRPVAQRVSILLAELVEILMALEHCIAALKDGFTDIKILSDSQTAAGILTLNWKSSNYIDTISDIKENIGTLMRYGMRTTLSWNPGHANIAGNEIADQLAKEAAKESMSLNEQYNVITMSDVKQAVKTSTKMKWQNRWTISESGRQLYDLIPMVGNASHLDMPNPQIGRVLTEMRTGYSKLNKYRNNIGQSPTPLCDCGEEETTEHYILHCHIYDHERDKLAVQLKTLDESFDLLHLLTRDSNKRETSKEINILGGIHQKYRALPRTSKPCTLILSLSNSILQYKEKLQ